MEWLFNPWLWIIIAVDILLSVNYKKWIGKAGEFWVKRELKKLPSEYLVINDVMIKTNDKKYTSNRSCCCFEIWCVCY